MFEVWAWVSPDGWERVAVAETAGYAVEVGSAWWESTGHRPIVHEVVDCAL